MKTEASEYLSLLQEIQNNNVSTFTVMPADEPRFTIETNSRNIIVPSEFSFLSVQNDHRAETIYFEIDRYFDNVDLSQHACVVQFINKSGTTINEGTYPVTSMDIDSVDGKILFGWEIRNDATQLTGDITFSVRFYSIDNNGNFTYNFNTLTASSYILPSLNIIASGERITATELEVWTDKMNNLASSIESDIITVEEKIEELENYIASIPEDYTALTEEVGKLSDDIATKASAIKEKASGEVIVVTDSDEQKPLGLAIYGKSEQNQYSGKNLLDARLNVDIKSNDSYKIYNVKPNKTYVLSLSQMLVVLGTNADAQHQYICYDETDNILKRGAIASMTFTSVGEVITKEATISTPENTSYIQLDLGTYFGANSSTVKTLYAQLEEGNVATEIEPYCGGIPSPNQSYPQEIRNIGVYDEASGKYAVEVKCTGKNWLQNNATSKTDGGVDFIVNDDKSVTINGVSTADVYLNLDFMEGGIPTSEYNVVTETEMVASFDNKVNGIQMAVGYFDESGKAVNMLSVDTADRTFIYPKTAVKARTYLYIQSGKTFNNVTVYPMIRPVGTDESYEPWKKPITATVLLDEPLRKGDKVFWNGSKQKNDRNRSVEVFDGSDDEKWTVQATNTSGKYRVKSGLLVGKAKPIGITIIGKHLCDSYVSVPSNTAGTFGCNSGLSIDDKGSVYVYDENFNTNDISLWKAHLAENPITVEYELAEPITEEIDIDLGELTMFYPTTILSNDCNANMEVEYIADTKAYIDKKFAELATAMV